MKRILFLISVFILSMSLSGCSIIGFKKISEEEIQNIVKRVQTSKIIILDVYHKHCESCKHIEPVIKKLESDYSQNPDVVFLKHDLSNPFTSRNSRAVGKALGIENIYKSQRFSGIVLVINTQSKKVLDTLVAEYNIDTYIKVIEKRLKDNES